MSDPASGSARSRLSAVASGRAAWALLVAVAVAALAVGSIHPPPQASSARISHLESVIKCPSCEDLSIAQSNAPTAVALRQDVVNQVHAGWSDGEIEQWVVARYGTAVLLDPPASGFDLLVWAVPVGVLAVAGASVGLVFWSRRKRGSVPSASSGGTPSIAPEDEDLVAAALAARRPSVEAGR